MSRAKFVFSIGRGIANLSGKLRFMHITGAKGWTIVELMLVLAIIGTLVGISLPSYTRYVERVRNQDVIIDIRMIEKDIAIYKELQGQFPESLDHLGKDIPLDRWANPYQYTRVAGANPGDLRKDHNMHPVNLDYDLYSKGADGKSAAPFTAKVSQDDIVRANNGEFLGLVSDY